MELFAGRINRKTYLLAITVVSVIAIIGHYLVQYFSSVLGFNGTQYLVTKGVLSLVYLAASMPFCVKRLNDIEMSHWWLVIFWIEVPFSIRNTVLIEEVWGINIDPFSWPLIILGLVSLVLAIVLFVKPGTHNKALQPTATASAEL